MFHSMRLSLNKVKINLNVYSYSELMNQIVFAYQKYMKKKNKKKVKEEEIMLLFGSLQKSSCFVLLSKYLFWHKILMPFKNNV